MVRAWHHTYGMPVLTTNCSNNYGPYHFPEKLIPLMIVNALAGKPLPVYGDGRQVRDWLFVADHCEAIRTVLAKGRDQFAGQIGLHKNPALCAPTGAQVADTCQLNLFSGATRHVYMKNLNVAILQSLA